MVRSSGETISPSQTKVLMVATSQQHDRRTREADHRSGARAGRRSKSLA